MRACLQLVLCVWVGVGVSVSGIVSVGVSVYLCARVCDSSLYSPYALAGTAPRDYLDGALPIARVHAPPSSDTPALVSAEIAKALAAAAPK